MPKSTHRNSHPSQETEKGCAPEPYSRLSDGATLLLELFAHYARFLKLSEPALNALVLWTVFTHLHDTFYTSPLLALLSPEKRCGKTTTLELLRIFCYRSMTTSNFTEAALFRLIDAYQPTLLVDEADTFLTRSAKNTIHGILNAGHTRTSAFVFRIAGNAPRPFSTWCPKAIALIGTLPTTLADRAITVPLARKHPSEHVDK